MIWMFRIVVVVCIAAVAAVGYNATQSEYSRNRIVVVDRVQTAIVDWAQDVIRGMFGR